MSKLAELKAALSDRESKEMRALLKILSLGTGIFLGVAGVVGCTSLITGQLVYFVASLYTIFFSCLVLIVEVKDKFPIVSLAYEWVETYLKFLTLQMGKGAFYLGVGILVFFIAPSERHDWGLNNFAALLLAFVGGLHTFRIIKEVGPALGPGSPMQPAAAGHMPGSSGDWSQPLTIPAAHSAAGSEWANMVRTS